MKLSMIAMVVAMGCAVSVSSAHADVQSEIIGAQSELTSIDSSMSQQEVMQKALRYVERVKAAGVTDGSANIAFGSYSVYNNVDRNGWQLTTPNRKVVALDGNKIANPSRVNASGATPATETVKGQYSINKDVSKLDVTPNKPAHIASQPLNTVIVNDSSAKRAHLLAMQAQPKVDGISQADSDRITAEMVKADQQLQNPDASTLGASKLVTAPSKVAHVASPVVVTDIHNDSTAKREQQTAITLAKSAPVVNASSYRMAIAQEEEKAAGVAVTSEPHQTATAHTVQAATLSASTKPAVQQQAVTVAQAQPQQQAIQQQPSYFVSDAETIQAVNDLVDAHNENVTAIDDHEQRIGALESHDKQQDKTIEHNNKKAMAGIAGALAQTGLHYTATANSVAIGGGNYAGESAVAVGYSHMWDGVRVSVQNSVDSMHNVGTSASLAVGW